MRSLLLAVTASLLLASSASAAPSWLPPVNLGAEVNPQLQGRVALGADGTAVAAWGQPVGGDVVLQVARRTPGSGFSAAATVSGTTAISGVNVGVDGAGNATILYSQGGAIVALPWPASESAPLTPQTFEAGTSPVLAVGRNGTAMAAWLTSGAAPVVRAAARDGSGGTFGTQQTISAPGDGTGSITGLDIAVGDAGNATSVWSRMQAPNQTWVEANVRAPGATLTDTTTQAISNTTAPTTNTSPAAAVDPFGRSTVLWEDAIANRIDYAEQAPGQSTWSAPQPASTTTPAATPAVGVAPSGAVVGAWQINAGPNGGAIQTAARPAGGGPFAGFQPISGPSMNAADPVVVVGGNGDALIGWALGDQKAVNVVQRSTSGAFGPIQPAITAANAPPGDNQNYENPSLGIDDQGNGIAAWTLSSFRNPTQFYTFQAASFDAAAPHLTASVPPGGRVGSAIGMAAAATDRVSPVTITWSFGDGGTATGGAVTHAFGTAGAFNVTVAATDAAGNAASSTHPVLVAALPPKPKPRVRSKLGITWGVAGKKIFLLRLKASKVPKGGKLELRCKGKQCPFKRVSSKKRKKGTITLFKAIKPSKVAGIKKRSFRAGQTLEVRITAPRRIGKVARYKLKAGRIPVAKDLCLPIGKKTPRKTCR